MKIKIFIADNIHIIMIHKDDFDLPLAIMPEAL